MLLCGVLYSDVPHNSLCAELYSVGIGIRNINSSRQLTLSIKLYLLLTAL
jgi:hypothetical protein